MDAPESSSSSPSSVWTADRLMALVTRDAIQHGRDEAAAGEEAKDKYFEAVRRDDVAAILDLQHKALSSFDGNDFDRVLLQAACHGSSTVLGLLTRWICGASYRLALITVVGLVSVQKPTLDRVAWWLRDEWLRCGGSPKGLSPLLLVTPKLEDLEKAWDTPNWDTVPRGGEADVRGMVGYLMGLCEGDSKAHAAALAMSDFVLAKLIPVWRK